MQVRNSPEGFGVVAMTLHLVVVVLVLCGWLMGQFGDALPEGPTPEAGEYVDILLGRSILALVAARLAWRLTDPPPPEDPDIGRWNEWAARAMHYIIYALLVVAPLAGIALQFA